MIVGRLVADGRPAEEYLVGTLVILVVMLVHWERRPRRYGQRSQSPLSSKSPVSCGHCHLRRLSRRRIGLGGRRWVLGLLPGTCAEVASTRVPLGTDLVCTAVVGLFRRPQSVLVDPRTKRTTQMLST